MSWVSPGIRYFWAMSLTCRPTSWRSRTPACLRASSVSASRKAVTASSGNLASMASGRPSGRNTTQSGRLLFGSVYWNSKQVFGSPSRTMISMRPWPNAPRACLLLSTLCRVVTCEARLGDVLLRAVDHDQAFVELLQALRGVLAGRAHRVAEVMRDRVEALVDRARKLGLSLADAAGHFGLTPGQHVAHHLDAHRGLGLQPRHLGHLPFGRLAVAPPHRAHDDDRDQHQEPASAARAIAAMTPRLDKVASGIDISGIDMLPIICHPTSIRS